MRLSTILLTLTTLTSTQLHAHPHPHPHSSSSSSSLHRRAENIENIPEYWQPRASFQENKNFKFNHPTTTTTDANKLNHDQLIQMGKDFLIKEMGFNNVSSGTDFEVMDG
jgi:hypothetical protein